MQPQRRRTCGGVYGGEGVSRRTGVSIAACLVCKGNRLLTQYRNDIAPDTKEGDGKGASDDCRMFLQDQRTSAPRDHRTKGPADLRTSGPKDPRTSGPKDQQTKGPGGQRTKGAADQRTSGPKDQLTKGPADQRTSGPKDHRTKGPAHHRTIRATWGP